MRYKNFDGPIEELIQIKLKEIEEKEQVTILHTIESGSRAWGFASPDSDYDVRFIYVRSMEYYLSLETKKDFIDWELDETLDMNGWDLSKALKHFHKSNATLFEWANSPVVYQTTTWWKEIMAVAENYFSCKASMYHYYGTAKKNASEYLTGEMVSYKKYFYVLRPILACKWIEQKKCPPPVLFQSLVDGVLEDKMKAPIEALVKKKMTMVEAQKGERIDRIDDYIAEKLLYYKQKLNSMEDDREGDWEKLNQVFLAMLKKDFL